MSSYVRVPQGRVDVVPNGVPDGPFGLIGEERRRVARIRMSVDPAAMVVAYVGALVPEKGVADLLEAVGRCPQVIAVIAGDGPQRAELEQQAAPFVGRARFVGTVDNAEEVFAAADVVALPSRGGDSMPATLIEAGLCGLAAIATPIGAIEEIVVDDETGVIIEPGDVSALAAAINRLAADVPLRRRLGEAARRRCLDRFEIDTVAAAWENTLYASRSSR